MHHPISPAILYWGTPVVLITTTNPDLTPNICPMSSAFWLGHRCILGLAAPSQTTLNILRTKQLVLNLPSPDLVGAINALARTTGRDPVPEWKAANGYRFVADKFGVAGLTAQMSERVNPPRIKECKVQMEAELVVAHEMMSDSPKLKGGLYNMEVKILRIHVEDELRLEGYPNRIDSMKWSPVIMSFQDLYGIRNEKLVESVLAKIGEENYRRMTESVVSKTEIEEVDG